MKNMKMLGLLAAAVGLLALPAGAGAEANGSDCSYTTTGEVAGLGVQAGSGGMTGTAGTAVGVCVTTGDGSGLEGGSLEVGTGGNGTYGVIDGDNQNVDPVDGYVGLSSYEDGATQDENCADGPDGGAAGSTNSGGCFGVDGGPALDLTALRDLGIPTPICGNTSGPSWNNTPRDGCSNP